jgi:hypothetical protein
MCNERNSIRNKPESFKDKMYAILDIYYGKKCTIGANNIDDNNFGEKICSIFFDSKKDVEELYNAIKTNSIIKITNEDIVLIFTEDSQKSVEVFKRWLFAVYECLSLEKESDV